MIPFLFIILGFVIMIFGASRFIDAAINLASKWGIPDIVIGLTIIAFGTSAPELVVNVMAAANQHTEIVLSNVLGSNIFNVLVILGIAGLITPLSVKSNTTWIEIPLNILAAIAVITISMDRWIDHFDYELISQSEGINLLLFFLIFLGYNIHLSKSSQNTEVIEKSTYSLHWALFWLILGIAGLIFGGRLIVLNAVNLAESWGVSERIIGLTIISIGTSLPEMITSILAAVRKKVDIAIGNVVGSNLFNVFFILGTSATIHPVTVLPAAKMDLYLNLLAAVLLFIFIFTGGRRTLERWEAIILLTLYGGYFYYIL